MASTAGQECHRQDRVGRRQAREERRTRFANVYADLPVRDVGDFTTMQTFDTSAGVLEKDAVTYTVKVVYLSVKAEIDSNSDGTNDSVLIDTTGDGRVNTVRLPASAPRNADLHASRHQMAICMLLATKWRRSATDVPHAPRVGRWARRWTRRATARRTRWAWTPTATATSTRTSS
jgi:hypothetical protein